jgi:23S rRNA (pseudouridine1915-N3)-methyltransferase
MKISCWAIGKANEAYIKEGIEDFTKRIGHYYKISWQILPVPKNAGAMSEADLRGKESQMILGQLKKEDWLVALDENGKQFSSEEFAFFIGERATRGAKQLVFLIGGAYGLDKSVLQRANQVMSLSRLTFPHQLVRLILSEQLYRACSILKNEKYHHG